MPLFDALSGRGFYCGQGAPEEGAVEQSDIERKNFPIPLHFPRFLPSNKVKGGNKRWDSLRYQVKSG